MSSVIKMTSLVKNTQNGAQATTLLFTVQCNILWMGNYMKLNKSKCHLLVSGNKYEHIWAKIGNEKIWESSSEKILGVEIR